MITTFNAGNVAKLVGNTGAFDTVDIQTTAANVYNTEDMIARCQVGGTQEQSHFERGVFYFNTSSLPDNAKILSAKVRLYVSAKTGTINGDGASDAALELRASGSTNTTYTTADYNINVSRGTTLASIAYGSVALDWNEFTIPVTSVNKTGNSQFSIYAGHDCVWPGINTDERYVVSWSSTPQLVVSYRTPGQILFNLT